MADERDPKVSQRYRELGAEEPPRRLDDAILAASRRRWRWGAPLAAAAVIVLSVALTWHMRVEEPDPNGYGAATSGAERKTEQMPADRPQVSQQRDAPVPRKPVPDARPAGPPPEVAASRMEERVPEERMRRAAPMADARAPQADALFSKQLAEEPPEKVLERIAELRKQGKHEEADKALEAFRKRYPDYKLPESVLKK